MLRRHRQNPFLPRLRQRHRPLRQHLHLQQKHLTSSSLLIGVQSKLSCQKDQISPFPLIGMRSRKYPGSRIRMTSSLAQILALPGNRRLLTLERPAQHRHLRQEQCLAVRHLKPPPTDLRVEVLGLLQHLQQMPGHHRQDQCLVKHRQEFRRLEDRTNLLRMHLKYPVRVFLQSYLVARRLTPRHQGRCHGRICRLPHLSTSAKCLTTTTL